jgi:hypothetical protein
MNGLGGLNKSPGGVVLGLVQLQNPVVATQVELAAQCRRICELTAKARRGMPSMDLVVRWVATTFRGRTMSSTATARPADFRR